MAPADTAAEQLRRWDAGETIWTIEMSGMGPGYEQAIQLLAIEIVRDNLGKPLPDPANYEWGRDTVTRVNEECGGFSGAQVGAARYLAFGWLKDGPAARLRTAAVERHIQASSFWPHLSPRS